MKGVVSAQRDRDQDLKEAGRNGRVFCSPIRNNSMVGIKVEPNYFVGPRTPSVGQGIICKYQSNGLDVTWIKPRGVLKSKLFYIV